MNTHTPGPWIPCYGKGRSIVNIECKGYGNNCHPIATIKGTDMEANAKLIAASPTLLEALRECVTDPFAHCLVHEDKDALYRRICAINDIARAAIAKATNA